MLWKDTKLEKGSDTLLKGATKHNGPAATFSSGSPERCNYSRQRCAKEKDHSRLAMCLTPFPAHQLLATVSGHVLGQTDL